MITESISINDSNFILHPSGAMYWKDEQILLIADVHFGKVMHFRKHGIAVPQEAMLKNFERLDEVISLFRPKSIYFLGDLFHSQVNNEWPLFEKWAKRQHCTITLIIGNHDIISPLRYKALGIEVIAAFQHKGFSFTHHPEISDTHFNIAGHIHPGITMFGKGKQRITAPCFYKTKMQLILPAFGVFTGKHIIKPAENDLIYATTKDAVILIALKP